MTPLAWLPADLRRPGPTELNLDEPPSDLVVGFEPNTARPPCDHGEMASFVSALEGLQLYTEGIGACAAILTTAAFAPQVIRTWRTGGAGLSWLMLLMLAVGAWMWFLYGLLRASVPIVAANGLTGLQILCLAVLKAWHARKAEPNPHPSESANFAESSETSR